MLRAALLTLFILIVLPAAANAKCRDAPLDAVWYDTPQLQVWQGDGGFVSCVRPTGVEHVFRDHGPDPEARQDFGGVWDDRYLSIHLEKGWESDDRSIESLGSTTYDTWTGQPGMGWTVSTGPEGIVLHHADGHTEVVDPAPVAEDLDLAYHGSRVYWRAASGARTALLNLPAEDDAPVARPVRARKMTRCTPRPGATLVARYRRVVVTRKGRSVHACFNQRVTPIGNATAVETMGVTDIAYTRPGYTGYLDVARGRKRELPSAGGPPAADLWTIAAVDRKGVLRMWNVDRRRPVVAARGGASEIAVTYEQLFWLDADGTPQVKDVRRAG